MENECDSENASDRDIHKYIPEKPLILLRISISYILLKFICGSAFKADPPGEYVLLFSRKH